MAQRMNIENIIFWVITAIFVSIIAYLFLTGRAFK